MGHVVAQQRPKTPTKLPQKARAFEATARARGPTIRSMMSCIPYSAHGAANTRAVHAEPRRRGNRATAPGKGKRFCVDATEVSAAKTCVHSPEVTWPFAPSLALGRGRLHNPPDHRKVVAPPGRGPVPWKPQTDHIVLYSIKAQKLPCPVRKMRSPLPGPPKPKEGQP